MTLCLYNLQRPLSFLFPDGSPQVEYGPGFCFCPSLRCPLNFEKSDRKWPSEFVIQNLQSAPRRIQTSGDFPREFNFIACPSCILRYRPRDRATRRNGQMGNPLDGKGAKPGSAIHSMSARICILSCQGGSRMLQEELLNLIQMFGGNPSSDSPDGINLCIGTGMSCRK